MFKKFLKRLTRVLKSTKGYTLVEVAAVVAITGTLAAVAVPVAKDQVAKGKIGAATSEVQTMAGAIMQLKGDSGVWPVFALGADRKSNAPNIMLLTTLKGTTPTASTWAIPKTADEGTVSTSAILASSAYLSSADPGYSPAVSQGSDSFKNHLVRNGSADIVGSEIYDALGWKGPYFSADKADPWGHKYLCNIGDLYKIKTVNGSPMPSTAVVVISAGPDGVVQTAVSQSIESFVLLGDDIAFRIQ